MYRSLFLVKVSGLSYAVEQEQLRMQSPAKEDFILSVSRTLTAGVAVAVVAEGT